MPASSISIEAPTQRRGPRRLRDRFRHLAAQGPAARQRHPRLRRAQSRLEAHLHAARRRGAGRPGAQQRPEDKRGCRARLSPRARLFASCGRAGTPARRAPTATSAAISRPRSKMAGRSPAGSATNSISARARPATAAFAASPTPPPRPTSRRRGSRCATAKATGAPRSRAANGNSSTTARSGSCPRAANSSRSRSTSCGTRRSEPKVLGIGYASVRDLVSFLRYRGRASTNPLLSGTSEIRHALAFGVSQSGRFLRHFLELGMNADDAGQRVFDGVFSHVAGAGKVFANHRFGMPGRTATQHEDRLYPENWFPFSMARTADPVSGRIGGLLGGAATDPKIIETNSATEYWQKGASLIHTDPGDRARSRATGECPRLPDRRDPAWRAARRRSAPRPVRQPAQPAQRDAGVAGPFRRARRMGDEGHRAAAEPGPLARRRHRRHRRDVRMPRVHRLCRPAPGANPILPPVDWVDPPEASPAALYSTFVSAVDSDGNETGRHPLPSIAVPLGTYTGWNVYRAQPDELADRDGSFIAFAAHPRRARGRRRPAPLARRTLRQPRGLCRPGRGRRRCPRRRAAAAAQRRRGLCRGRTATATASKWSGWRLPPPRSRVSMALRRRTGAENKRRGTCLDCASPAVRWQLRCW